MSRYDTDAVLVAAYVIRVAHPDSQEYAAAKRIVRGDTSTEKANAAAVADWTERCARRDYK